MYREINPPNQHGADGWPCIFK